MQLYDTLTRGKQQLPPAPGPVRMYTCGPTVYQRIHIGNARPFVISMWLRRWLEHQGYEATLVENITDVNDKIYDAAPNHSAELAAQASQWYIEDTEALGLGRPDHEPKATETIAEIVALIEELIAGGHAYEAGSCVVVGRGAQCILQAKADVFHAFVYAPLRVRIHRLRTSTVRRTIRGPRDSREAVINCAARPLKKRASKGCFLHNTARICNLEVAYYE